MKSFIPILLSLLVSAVSDAQAPKEKTLLWKVTGQNAKPSYLFGTMHMMCSSDIVMSDKLKAAFNDASKIYMELDMDDPGMMMEMMMGMNMKNNESLDSLLPKDQYDSAAKVFQKMSGFSLNMMKKAQPMLLMSMVYPAMMKCPADGWEMQFIQMAKKDKKEIMGLEKVKDQMDVFNKIPYKTQAEMFAQTLLNIDSAKNSMAEMVAAYKTKDLSVLEALSTSDKDFSKYEDDMLNNRNRNWIPVIEKAMKEDKLFIAVGAAHLAGNNGVISLLRKAGYKVEPVYE